MATYMTDKHGKRWALVPEWATAEMVDATYSGQPCDEIFHDMLAAAPDFEPAQPSDSELDALMPEPAESAYVQGRASQGGEYRDLAADYDEWSARFSVRGLRKAMRAAMALHNAEVTGNDRR